MWDEELKDSLVQCFEIVKDSSLEDDKVTVSLNNGGSLLQMEYVSPSEHIFRIHCEFELQFTGKEPVKVKPLEEEMTRVLFSIAMMHFSLTL